MTNESVTNKAEGETARPSDEIALRIENSKSTNIFMAEREKERKEKRDKNERRDEGGRNGMKGNIDATV